MTHRILVIDDEPSIRKSFSLALEDTGYEVVTFPSGREGLDYLGTASVDLVFLDLNMPEMNGVEVLRAIRGRDESVPIYIVTAYYGEFADELEELTGRGVGFELIKKPLSLEQIEMVARAVLDGPQQY